MLIDNPALQIVAGLARNFLSDDLSNTPNGFRPELLEPHVAFNMETLLARRTVFDLVAYLTINWRQLRMSTGFAERVTWACLLVSCRRYSCTSGFIQTILT